MESTPQLRTLSIGMPQSLQTAQGKEYVSAICKQSAAEVFLSMDGFQGDGIADTKHHGGPDRAVCIYPFEHYALWEKEFGCTLSSSTFGENLTVSGMLEEDICIGDIFQVGEAVIQVTQGRVPCSTINMRTGLPDLMKKLIETGYTGYLCRVLNEGIIRSDSPINLLARDPEEVTILQANEVYFRGTRDLEGMKRVAAVGALAAEWQKKLASRMEKLQTV